MIGKIISHYRILEKLGEGGMGVVYKAEDTKLKRPVALKFLPAELTRDEEAKERFIQEAQAASLLDHNNICTIHEIGEAEDEQIFIAMSCYEGETLKKKLERGALPLEQAIDIAIQVAEGLGKAHSSGIVHRDVKPANIIITNDGVAKILDFGLAKLADRARLTKIASAVGTAAYMSPEQVRGDEVDSRTDIWSFGIVLYEAVTGKLPFWGEYEPAIIYSILNDRPKPMTGLRKDVPWELERVVEKSLAKRSNERYQTMTELLLDLRALSEKAWGRLSDSGPGRRGAVEAAHRKKSIAVLPFVSMSESKEDEYFSDGTTEDIIAQLSKIRDLRVISRTSAMRYKHSDKSIPEIGRELGVATILEGSVRRAGGRVRIVAQLLDVQTDEHVWAETYDREMKDVFGIQSDVAENIASALRAHLSPTEREQIEKKPTLSTEAYNYYLKGRFCWGKRRGEDLERAVGYFNRAIEIDPTYALAYVGLASAYLGLPEYAGLPAREYMPKAEAQAKRALELDPALGEAHAVLGLIKKDYEWDWVGAESEFRRAIELSPSFPTAHHWYCLLLNSLGRFEEALAEIRLAQELDPLSLIISTIAGVLLYATLQYDKAEEQLRKTLELDPDFAWARFELAMVYIQQGQLNKGIAELEKLRATAGHAPYVLWGLGYAYARAGRRSEATKMLSELLQLSKQGFSVSFGIAVVHWGLGEKDQALEWLENACEERDTFLEGLKIDPVWKGLRSDPKFAALLKKMGLEK